MSGAALTLGNEAIAVGAPRPLPGLEERLSRSRRFQAAVAGVDTAIIIAVSAATAWLQSVFLQAHARAEVIAPAIILAAAWALALRIVERRAVHRGAEPLSTMPVLISAAVGLVALAVFASMTQIETVRLHVLITAPVAALAITASHQLWRARARHMRGDRRPGPRTLVVGNRADVTAAVSSLAGNRGAHSVVGVALDDAEVTELTVDGIRHPNLGRYGQTAQIAREMGVDRVVVVGCGGDPDFIRRLSWTLEGTATELVLATRLTDVAPARVAFDHVDGLAMTHIRIPRFDRATTYEKRMLDIVVASLALIPIALLTPLIALAIAIDSPGGVFFRQKRIGHDGREFDILKFRTMRSDAESALADLLAQNQGAGPLFKLARDPRVTYVGAFLRRYSLDELPQFWNVLKGDMSVVGPRPPLPSEVSQYADDEHRRLYVQPGITGLWQISGRSDLTWEQSVRLDLHYVENWSLMTDLKIILRTAAAMVRPKGAY